MRLQNAPHWKPLETIPPTALLLCMWCGDAPSLRAMTAAAVAAAPQHITVLPTSDMMSPCSPTMNCLACYSHAKSPDACIFPTCDKQARGCSRGKASSLKSSVSACFSGQLGHFFLPNIWICCVDDFKPVVAATELFCCLMRLFTQQETMRSPEHRPWK